MRPWPRLEDVRHSICNGDDRNKRHGLRRHRLRFGAAGPGTPGPSSLPFVRVSASEDTRDPRCVSWPPKMCGVSLRKPQLLDSLLLEKKVPCRVADKAGWLLQGQARSERGPCPLTCPPTSGMLTRERLARAHRRRTRKHAEETPECHPHSD